MKLKLNELPDSIKALNPHIFVGGVEKPFTQHNLARALDRSSKPSKTGKDSVVVSLIRFASRRLDDDNLAGGLKPLRDSIANTLGIDDGDNRIRWEYGQVITQGQQGTAVRIETTNNL